MTMHAAGRTARRRPRVRVHGSGRPEHDRVPTGSPALRRRLDWMPTPAAPCARSLVVPRCPCAPSFITSPTTPTPRRSPATAAARSRPRRCGRTSSRRSPTRTRRARRSSSPATTARRATSPATCAPGCTRGRVRFYPSRGVAYESHLTPPPHLVGLRVAALDALLDDAIAASARDAPVVVVSAVALSREGPRPEPAPALVHAARRRPARPRRVHARPRRRRLRARRPGRGPRPVRRPRRAARHLPGDRGPRRARRPLRHRDRVAALVLDVHPALARRGDRGRDRARRRARRRASRARRDRRDGVATRRGRARERPDVAELLPVERFGAFLDLAPDAAVLLAAEEEIEPALADHWQDVCAAFHDDDAHHLYVSPDDDHRRARRPRAGPPVLARHRPAARVPRPGARPRRALAEGGRARAREARALGLPHGRRLAAARRGRARRLQPRAPEGVVAGGGRSRRASRTRCASRTSGCATASSPPA